MKWLRASCLLLIASLLVAAWSCGNKTPGDTFGPPGGRDGSTAGGDDGSVGVGTGDDGPGYMGFGDGSMVTHDSGGATGCQNLQCQVHTCGGLDGGDAGGTTLSGTVLDPAGRNPLYNVVVYIPNAAGGKLDSIPIGVGANSCSCGALFSGEPISYAVTDTAGNFTLYNVPDGDKIPLVVQIGKWRKEIIVPTITQCSTTNSAGKITLPKNLSDGLYASLPNIAVSTGGLDTLECLLTRVGVDEAFFTGQTAGPGVHVFQGSGGNAAAGSQSSPAHLWDSLNDLKQYDIIMLSCEGSPTAGVDATTATYLAPYIDQGGRVFAEHYHYAFFTGYTTNTGPAYPEFTNVASWTNLGNGNDQPYNDDITGVIETTLPNGSNFPEGKALKSWLGNVKALNAGGEIVVPSATARDTATISATNLATPWVVTDPTIKPASAQYFSWDMPFDAGLNDAGAPEYCGRAVYSDMHVSGSASDYTGNDQTVPGGCDSTSALSPDEDAIEFILFDLSSCITPVGFTPQPPPPEGGIAQ